MSLAWAGCSESSRAGAAGKPLRIVTLSPSSSELVVAVGARDRLVGIDKYSVESGNYGDLPVVGDFLNPSFEAIARLKPDLVIADELQSKVVKGLEAAKLKTLTLPMHRMEDVIKGLTRVGEALGTEPAAKAAATKIRSALDGARSRAKARKRTPRVLVILDRQPESLGGMVAAGPGSYADELLAAIGAENILSSSAVHYPRISAEEILRGRPDVIIDSSPAARSDMAAWKQLAGTPAVDESRVVATAEPALTTPSPRLDVALAELERVVYGSPSR